MPDATGVCDIGSTHSTDDSDEDLDESALLKSGREG